MMLFEAWGAFNPDEFWGDWFLAVTTFQAAYLLVAVVALAILYGWLTISR